MSSLRFHYEHLGQRESLVFDGGVDVKTFAVFESILQSIADNGTGDVEIDLRAVDAFNSPAVGSLVMLATQRRGHGSVVRLICRGDGSVASMIQRARLEGVFSMKLLGSE